MSADPKVSVVLSTPEHPTLVIVEGTANETTKVALLLTIAEAARLSKDLRAACDNPLDNTP